jgi:hypothetical protein
MAAIITGVIRQTGTLLGAILLPRCNRKYIMVFSAAAMTLTMASLGNFELLAYKHGRSAL